MTLDWPEDVARIEGKERIVLDETPGMQAPPSVASAAPAAPAAAMKPAE
jgi:hypothetical protein